MKKQSHPELSVTRGTEQRPTERASLSLDTWEEIEELAPAREYAAGTVLFTQASPARQVYLIKQGLVKLARLEEEGRTTIIGLRWPGWLLGAASAILQRPYPATAETLTRCCLCRFRTEDFRHLLRANDDISWRLHQMHSHEVYTYVMQLGQKGGLLARHRLEQFLWDLVLAQGKIESRKPVRLPLPLKHWELAQLIAVTPVHLSRLLKQLEREGMLQRHKGWLILPEPWRLWHQFGM